MNNYKQEKNTCFYKIMHFSVQISAVLNMLIVKTKLKTIFLQMIKKEKIISRKMFKVTDLVCNHQFKVCFGCSKSLEYLIVLIPDLCILPLLSFRRFC